MLILSWINLSSGSTTQVFFKQILLLWYINKNIVFTYRRVIQFSECANSLVFWNYYNWYVWQVKLTSDLVLLSIIVPYFRYLLWGVLTITEYNNITERGRSWSLCRQFCPCFIIRYGTFVRLYSTDSVVSLTHQVARLSACASSEGYSMTSCGSVRLSQRYRHAAAATVLYTNFPNPLNSSP